MKKLAAVSVTVSVLAFGCATLAPATPAELEAAATVRVQKADPPENCVRVGAVSAGDSMADADAIDAKLRLAAARKGGNFVRLEAMNAGYSKGTAFQCPEAAPPTAPSP
jgi:hypothetical protein